MKKKLFSIDGYNEIEIDFEKIDLVNAIDISSLLKTYTDCNVVMATRDVSVYVTLAEAGEEIDLRNRYNLLGRSYIFNNDKYQIKRKDVETESRVILYTNGMSQIVKGEIFEEKYILVDKVWQLYSYIDKPKKYVTVTKHFCFKSPWGEIIYAPTGSKLCVEFIDEREFFVVSNSFFKSAYNIQEELGDIDNLIKNQQI